MFAKRIHKIAVAIFLLAVLLAGCQSAPTEEDPLVFFPVPPAKPRIQFLTWVSGSAELEPEKSFLEKIVLSEESLPPRLINKPYGIAARNGVVYVYINMD